MSSVPEVAQAMSEVLAAGAEQAAAATGLVQRRSKLSGSIFTQTLVFGWLADPDASLCSLTQMAATLGVEISSQALFQRFTPRAAECLRQVLAAAVVEVIAAEPVAVPILQRFSDVLVQHSSVVMLPDALREIWAGCGGSGSYGQSALKLQVRLDLTTGRMLGPFLDHGRTPDSHSPVQSAPLPPGALRLADLGYYRLDTFRENSPAKRLFPVPVQDRHQTATSATAPNWTWRGCCPLPPPPASTSRYCWAVPTACPSVCWAPEYPGSRRPAAPSTERPSPQETAATQQSPSGSLRLDHLRHQCARRLAEPGGSLDLGPRPLAD